MNLLDHLNARKKIEGEICEVLRKTFNIKKL